MALIHGTTSKWPCPICFVGADELSDITKTWTLRTAVNTQEILWQAHGIQGITECEKLLSEHGIRDVDVSNLFFRPCAHPNSNTPLECILGSSQLRSPLCALVRQASFKQQRPVWASPLGPIQGANHRVWSHAGCTTWCTVRWDILASWMVRSLTTSSRFAAIPCWSGLIHF